MVDRVRNRFLSAGTGHKTFLNGNVISTHTNLASSSTISDVVAGGSGHDLTISKITLKGGIIAHACSPGNITGRCLVNIQPDAMRNPSDTMYVHYPISGRPTNAALAAELLAKTNPSRPVVDLPIAVYELRELPSLLRREGGGWIRRLASLNLKYHFGIKPLVNDIVNLLNFSDEVDKRQKELDALHNGGLRRRRNLWSGAITGSTNRTVHSGEKFLIHCQNSVATRARVWGFTTWKPDGTRLMKGDQRALARQAVLGLTIDFATAWNAIPWTWLIDWCSNVGDVLIANRNIVGAVHGPIQIMELIESTAICTIDHPAVQKASWELVTKTRRTVTNVPISAQLPILSLRQLSILGSIGVTRRVPRSS